MLFPALIIFLLKTYSTGLLNAFSIFRNVCSISDLNFVSDSLPRGIIEILFVSKLNRDAKVFSNEFFYVYLLGLCFSSEAWVSLMILLGIKLEFFVIFRRIRQWSEKKFKA